MSLAKKSWIPFLRLWHIQSWDSVQQTGPADKQNWLRMKCFVINSQIILFSSNWCEKQEHWLKTERKRCNPPGFSGVGRLLQCAPWSQREGIQGSWWVWTWPSTASAKSRWNASPRCKILVTESHISHTAKIHVHWMPWQQKQRDKQTLSCLEEKHSPASGSPGARVRGAERLRVLLEMTLSSNPNQKGHLLLHARGQRRSWLFEVQDFPCEATESPYKKV